MSTMESFRKLHVKLAVHEVFWGSLNGESAKVLLEPIKKVTRPGSFILSHPFPAMDEREPVINFPWTAGNHWGEDL